MFIISTAAMILAAFAGRWIQLNPGKLILQGTFVGPDAPTAIIARKVLSLMGTFFVLFGVLGAVFSLSFPIPERYTVIHVLFMPVGLACGIFVAIRVRKEVRAKLKIVPGQFGLWP